MFVSTEPAGCVLRRVGGWRGRGEKQAKSLGYSSPFTWNKIPDV